MTWPRTPSSQGCFDFDATRAEAAPEVVTVPEPEPEPELVAEPLAVRLPEPAPASVPGPRIYGVAELVRHAARTLEARYGDVWVEGEVCNLSAPRSGHLYFTMREADAQLPAVMFRTEAARLKFEVEDGLKVRARGRLSVYGAQGKFQLYVDELEPAGVGALQVAFEQLKRKLEAEGLFDRRRKRPLPPWPRRIGICTSPSGAAIRDILRIAERRGRMRLLLAPCLVQGDGAPAQIIRALRALERQRDVDVIIVGRGGGSLEDLAAFNDEALARALAACRVPVVSAVGHEVDFTIADFVADVRAPTPSAAAELCVPLFADAEVARAEAEARLLRAGRRCLADARQALDGEMDGAQAVLHRLVARLRRVLQEQQASLAGQHPRARLHRDRALLQALRVRLEARLRLELNQRRRAFGAAAGKLEALSPLSCLERGYSLTRRLGGEVVTDAAQVHKDELVVVTLARGELSCRVQSAKREGASGDDPR